MSIHSYSQFGEDVFIAQHFDPEYKGICIDIGATDGIDFSNTYHFEQHGWKAICVEANPAMIPVLKKNRANGVHCAVGQFNNEEVEFNVVKLQGGNETAISGLSLDQRLIQSHAFLNPQVNVIKVPSKTLNNIIADFDWVTHIDFISIDTEGTELDVLKGFDIPKWNVKMFCIENNFNDPEIEQYLALFGYCKVRRHEVNDFYTKCEYSKGDYMADGNSVDNGNRINSSMEFLQPKKIILKQSPIHGLGVFASDKIFAGEVFEECPVLTLPIPKNQRSPLLIDYRFNWPQGTEPEEQVIALGYGCFYNHSENANCYWVSDVEKRTFKFISHRDIEIGEELLTWYGDVSYWNDGRQKTVVV